jgi:hypothetical protein
VRFTFFAGGLAASGMAIDMGVAAPEASSFFTDAEILSAFFTSTLTCQICGSVSWPLNPGMPVSRMPFSAFQYDSHASSSVTPTPWNSCGGAGNIPSAIALFGSPGNPWQTAQFSL